ncbi:hypothetical protein DBQ68_10565 [Lactobacillus sp. DS15_6]|nr:hypothetical protein [Lacticaseibacillus paracasei]PTS49647.1 hypothetical protein DBQ62_09830 [Lactobacillus sp. DS9_6]PTS60893.1 hypothetical protein DBQ68_10565 [Lactobacillus sp. DS15_6]MCT3362476.1 hypothetical protein [Lacticaseibacillus paracasei]QDR74474.1 hypothetical protein FO269_04530 [Lacticaseibacillus paracasei]
MGTLDKQQLLATSFYAYECLLKCVHWRRNHHVRAFGRNDEEAAITPKSAYTPVSNCTSSRALVFDVNFSIKVHNHYPSENDVKM